MVDGSNESLYRPDEESDPILRKGIPLQKCYQKLDVHTVHFTVCDALRMTTKCRGNEKGPMMCQLKRGPFVCEWLGRESGGKCGTRNHSLFEFRD